MRWRGNAVELSWISGLQTWGEQQATPSSEALALSPHHIAITARPLRCARGRVLRCAEPIVFGPTLQFTLSHPEIDVESVPHACIARLCAAADLPTSPGPPLFRRVAVTSGSVCVPWRVPCV